MNIYVNNKLSNISNIFQFAENELCLKSYEITEKDLNRSIHDILEDYVLTHKTYYYIKNKKYVFELR